MPIEVLDANANREAIQAEIDSFASGVSSIDSTPDVTRTGPDRVVIVVDYTA